MPIIFQVIFENTAKYLLKLELLRRMPRRHLGNSAGTTLSAWRANIWGACRLCSINTIYIAAGRHSFGACWRRHEFLSPTMMMPMSPWLYDDFAIGKESLFQPLLLVAGSRHVAWPAKRVNRPSRQSSMARHESAAGQVACAPLSLARKF